MKLAMISLMVTLFPAICFADCIVEGVEEMKYRTESELNKIACDGKGWAYVVEIDDFMTRESIQTEVQRVAPGSYNITQTVTPSKADEHRCYVHNGKMAMLVLRKDYGKMEPVCEGHSSDTDCQSVYLREHPKPDAEHLYEMLTTCRGR